MPVYTSISWQPEAAPAGWAAAAPVRPGRPAAGPGLPDVASLSDTELVTGDLNRWCQRWQWFKWSSWTGAGPGGPAVSHCHGHRASDDSGESLGRRYAAALLLPRLFTKLWSFQCHVSLSSLRWFTGNRAITTCTVTAQCGCHYARLGWFQFKLNVPQSSLRAWGSGRAPRPRAEPEAQSWTCQWKLPVRRL